MVRIYRNLCMACGEAWETADRFSRVCPACRKKMTESELEGFLKRLEGSAELLNRTTPTPSREPEDEGKE